VVRSAQYVPLLSKQVSFRYNSNRACYYTNHLSSPYRKLHPFAIRSQLTTTIVERYMSASLVFRGVSKPVVMARPENTEDLRPLAVGQEGHPHSSSIYAQLH
jgi:hypothetical protein